MREIKFRVWMNYVKKNVCPMCSSEKEHYVNGFKYIPEDVSLTSEVIEDYPIIEQYTGLKDKQGKEIYEGDIIAEYGYIIGIITFNSNNFAGIPGFHICDKNDKSVCFYYGLVPDEEDSEVIGNIHENPELVEKIGEQL